MEFYSPGGWPVYQVTPGCAESFRPAISATQAVKYFALFVGLLSYYAGSLSSVLYLFSCISTVAFIRKIEFRFLVVFVLLVLFFVVRISLYSEFLYETVRDYRFFWGFIAFLLFFSSERYSNHSKRIDYAPLFRTMVDLVLALLLVEFLTANIFTFQWPNRVHDLMSDLEQGAARAYGFGGNASVTSVLVIVLSMVLFKGSARDIFVLGMATSATGALVFIVKLFARAKKLSTVLLVLFMSAVFAYHSKQIADISGLAAIEKVSFDYFSHIFGVKLHQFNEALGDRLSIVELILGRPLEMGSSRAGDFQLLDFFVFNGLAGTALLFLVLWVFVNRSNVLPILLLLAGSFHYQVIFSIPGQIVFAWLLSLSRTSFETCRR